MSEQDCPMCRARGKDWDGDDPKCAFRNGTFTADNWNCATMNRLREIFDEQHHWNGDQKCATQPFGDYQFLILGWYKNRGRTEFAGILTEREIKTLTLEQARLFLLRYKADVGLTE